MDTIEISLHSAAAKQRTLTMLRSLGYDVETGPVRMAYRFCISALLDAHEIDDVLLMARAIDPTAGQIVIDHQRVRANVVRTH